MKIIAVNAFQLKRLKRRNLKKNLTHDFFTSVAEVMGSIPVQA